MQAAPGPGKGRVEPPEPCTRRPWDTRRFLKKTRGLRPGGGRSGIPSSRSGQQLGRTCWRGARLRLRAGPRPLPSSAGRAVARRGDGDPRGRAGLPCPPPNPPARSLSTNDALGRPSGPSEGVVSPRGGGSLPDPEALPRCLCLGGGDGLSRLLGCICSRLPGGK